MIFIDHKQNPITILTEGKSYFLSSWQGVEELGKKMQGKEEPIKPTSKFIAPKEVLRIAGEWVGHDFKPGESAQCANFVRSVLEEAGFKIGEAKKPVDLALLPEGSPLAPSYANSFAGDDIGLKITEKELLPGDIVLFKNTYGDWEDGVITHVGIYEGNGAFVHRPTSAKPVKRDNLQIYGHFREGRRLYLK